ncbi:DUF1254 domain-containing protein [Pseudahrensia aquimaris]|uniref:DUF1254 domain-containing protein n=1 Tax=Pseudahrensia aquimaris TaxID=744461 RepID=A0ABW3FBN8_9HYPH
MRRLIYGTTLALVLAGIVHILVVLLIPSYAERDAWAKLASKGEPWEFSVVARPGLDKTSELPLADPSFGVAACRFDLSESPLVVEAAGNLPFWSVALFDRRGRNFYSFNDRTAIGRQLYMIVVNPVQMAQLRKNPPEDTERAVLIESDLQEGFILIRALQDNAARAPAVQKFLNEAQCSRYSLPESDGTS